MSLMLNICDNQLKIAVIETLLKKADGKLKQHAKMSLKCWEVI